MGASDEGEEEIGRKKRLRKGKGVGVGQGTKSG